MQFVEDADKTRETSTHDFIHWLLQSYVIKHIKMKEKTFNKFAKLSTKNINSKTSNSNWVLSWIFWKPKKAKNGLRTS